MIPRLLYSLIEKRWNTGKAIVVLGPRQVGKTTLLKAICQQKGEFLLLDADDFEIKKMLESANVLILKQLFGSHKTVFIDEAQRVHNIGITLKIIADQLPEICLLVSGSSALELANTINEPLTGRKWEFLILPISWQELVKNQGYLETKRQLEIRLIYGMYPDVINRLGDEKETLKQLSSSYLYKDLLNYGGIRKPLLIEKLLTALALQLGAEVSYNELSQLLQIDRATVEQYLNLLEKAYIIFRLQPLSRNLRNEINSSRKVYFYDNGIRNAILADFKPLALRNDTGALWENFLMSERQKSLNYNRIWAKSYFWRTYQQQEIDYVEESDGKFVAFEFKWNNKAKAKFSNTFTKAYQPIKTQVIHPENFEEFLNYNYEN
jgi:predicted AAA+ superfamily ATPase